MSVSKMPRTGSDSPWTPTEFDLCVNLVLTARRHGGFQDVMDKVKRIEEGRQAELAAVGLTDGDYRSCFRGEPCSGLQAMTDGSKRRLDEGPMDDPENDIAQGYVFPSMSADPFPAGMSTAVVSKLPTLPPGVSSVEDWGTYQVAFGKFQGKKIYSQILTEKSDEMNSYRNYLMSHRFSGSAQLKDLVAFMMASGYQGEKDQRPMIPGTAIARKR
jgi:hypothetical protein